MTRRAVVFLACFRQLLENWPRLRKLALSGFGYGSLFGLSADGTLRSFFLAFLPFLFYFNSILWLHFLILHNLCTLFIFISIYIFFFYYSIIFPVCHEVRFLFLVHAIFFYCFLFVTFNFIFFRFNFLFVMRSRFLLL